MEIYIEYVIIDNLVINYLILFLTAVILKRKKHKVLIMLSSIFGTICSLFFPLFMLENYLLIPLKLLVGLSMVFLAFRSRKIKDLMLIFLVFLTVTAVVGGVAFFILYLFASTTEGMILSGYNLPVPMGLIFFVLACYIYLLYSLILYFQRRKNIDGLIFGVEFFTNEKSVKDMAFLDTGNTLCDPETNQPVIIITYDLFRKMHDISMENLLLRKLDSFLACYKYIKYSTISNEKKDILIFKIPKVEIQMSKEKIVKENIFLGLSFSKCIKGCNALLNPQLF